LEVDRICREEVGLALDYVCTRHLHPEEEAVDIVEDHTIAVETMLDRRRNLQRKQDDLLRRAQECVERMEALRARHPRERAAAGVDSSGRPPADATSAQRRALLRLEKLEADHGNLWDEKKRTAEHLSTATNTLDFIDELLGFASFARRSTRIW